MKNKRIFGEIDEISQALQKIETQKTKALLCKFLPPPDRVECQELPKQK
jgi:hypothetical protein